MGLGDCPNENCMTGDVDWTEFRSAIQETLAYGGCDNCGTEALRCPECDEACGFFLN